MHNICWYTISGATIGCIRQLKNKLGGLMLASSRL